MYKQVIIYEYALQEKQKQCPQASSNKIRKRTGAWKVICQKTGCHGNSNTKNRNDGNIPKMQAIVSQTIANTYGKQPFHS